MNNESYINSSGRKVLEYINPDIIALDLPFILTTDKKLFIGMPYLKVEQAVGKTIINTVRLLDVSHDGDIVNLKIQDLQTKNITDISWNLAYNGTYWLWSLSSLEWHTSLVNKRTGNH